jgi:hypothetical protein
VKVGDTKKAAVLGVVAVAAVLYLGKSLLNVGGGSNPAANPTANAHADQAPHEALPLEVSVDRFSHPALAKLLDESPRTNAGREEGAAAPPTIPGNLPAIPSVLEAGMLGPGNTVTVPDQVPEPTKPQESGGPPRQEHQESRGAILLTAVLVADDPVAFISVNGKESVGCRVGAEVTDGVVIEAIREDHIVLRVRKKTKVVRPGETLNL